MSGKEEYKTNYMSVLTKYIASEKTLNFARSAGIENMAVKSLSDDLTRMRKRLDEYNRRLSEEMLVNLTNIIKLNEKWFAVTLIGDKGKRYTVVDPLNETDVGIVTRDLNTERDLTQHDYERIRPSIIDTNEIKRHEAEISQQAESVLFEYWGIQHKGECSGETSPQNIVPAARALQWWLENGVRDKESFIDGVQDEGLKNDLVGAFCKAKLEFRDGNGVSYFVDKTKLLLFTVISGLLMEVSRYDFGFIPRINRQILASQIKYVNTLKEFTEGEEGRIAGALTELANEDEANNAAIKDLEKQLYQKMQIRFDNHNRKTEYEKEIKNLGAALNAETSKVYPVPRIFPE